MYCCTFQEAFTFFLHLIVLSACMSALFCLFSWAATGNPRKLLPRAAFIHKSLSLSLPFPRWISWTATLHWPYSNCCQHHHPLYMCYLRLLRLPLSEVSELHGFVRSVWPGMLASGFYLPVKHELFVYKWAGSTSTNRIPCQIPCAFILLKEQKEYRAQNTESK